MNVHDLIEMPMNRIAKLSETAPLNVVTFWKDILLIERSRLDHTKRSFQFARDSAEHRGFLTEVVVDIQGGMTKALVAEAKVNDRIEYMNYVLFKLEGRV